MNRNNINLIGKWLVGGLALGLSGYFASKGNNDAAFGFGAFAAFIIFFSIMDS